MLGPGNADDRPEPILSSKVQQPPRGNRKGTERVGPEFSHQCKVTFHHCAFGKGRPCDAGLNVPYVTPFTKIFLP